MSIKRLLLTAKLPMRLVAILVIVFLVSATTLYFYDTLISGFDKLTWHGNRLVDERHAKHLSLAMAMTIGLGVFAESAATIWDKLMYWGQAIDNRLKRLLFKETYFLLTANQLLIKMRREVNRTNLQLQSAMIAQVDTQKSAQFLEQQMEKIKDYCEKVHHLLESDHARDNLNKQKQEAAKESLNRLVTANLEICYYVERLKGNAEVLN